MNVFSIYFFQIRLFQVTLGVSQLETIISNFQSSEMCENQAIFGDFRPKMGQNYRNEPKLGAKTISIPTTNLRITIAGVFFKVSQKTKIFSIFIGHKSDGVGSPLIPMLVFQCKACN